MLHYLPSNFIVEGWMYVLHVATSGLAAKSFVEHVHIITCFGNKPGRLTTLTVGA